MGQLGDQVKTFIAQVRRSLLSLMGSPNLRESLQNRERERPDPGTQLRPKVHLSAKSSPQVESRTWSLPLPVLYQRFFDSAWFD
jgi:hypothetical protein